MKSRKDKIAILLKWNRRHIQDAEDRNRNIRKIVKASNTELEWMMSDIKVGA